MNKLQRLRTALEAKPQLLADLVQSLDSTRPRILGPWRPDLQTIGSRFVAQRCDIFGNPVIWVAPQSREGHRGPWDVETTHEWKDHLTQTDKNAICNIKTDNPSGYTVVRERADKTLADLGFVLFNHRYPEVVFGPWIRSADTRYTRPVKRLDPNMPEDFSITLVQRSESTVFGPTWKWEVFVEPGNRVDQTEPGFRDLSQAQAAADAHLVSQGYNMARPSSFLVELRSYKENGTLGPWEASSSNPNILLRHDEHGTVKATITKLFQTGKWKYNNIEHFVSDLTARRYADNHLKGRGWTLTDPTPPQDKYADHRYATP
jgi:hypothetical protein